MSIAVKRTIDARIDGASSVNMNHDFSTGASSQTWVPFEATSKSSGSLEFSVLVPGQNAYWNRRVMLETTTNFKCKAMAVVASEPYNAGAGNAIFGRDVSVCSFPMNSLIQTATTAINGSTITVQNSQIMPLVRRLVASNKETRRRLTVPSGVVDTADIAQSGLVNNAYVSSPSDFDTPDSNSSACTFTWTNAAGVPDKSNAAPLTPFEQATAPSTLAGMWTSETELYFSITTREPVLAAPFLLTDDEPGFTNVQGATVRFTLMQPGDPSVRLIRTIRRSLYGVFGNITGAGGDSLKTVFGITNVAYASNSPFPRARLWCNFMSPSPDMLVPASTIYPYLQFDPLASASASNTAITSVSVDTDPANTVPTSDLHSQTVILNTCPDMIAVYAVLGDPKDVPDTLAGLLLEGSYSGREDMFATIDRLQITWNNQPSLLASASASDLWRMSYDNGLKTKYSTYSGVKNAQNPASSDTQVFAQGNVGYDVGRRTATTGGPVLLQINKDFPTEPGTAAGVAGVFSLTVTASVVTYESPSAPFTGLPQGTFSSRPVTLFVVPIRSSYLQLNAGGTSSTISAVSSGEGMLDAPFSSARVTQEAMPAMTGSGMFSNLGSRAADIWKRGQELHALAKQHAPMIKQGLDMMGSHGAAIKGAMESVGLGGNGRLIGTGAYGSGVEAHGAYSNAKRARYEGSAYMRH